ncbi:glycerophosphodiester phosphodiesterase domain-containing protein [Acrasis kona]|uniref:Glycerophosphodiester phosphodiesterase domain-containing protein n=1 Tax=Acrasis kona TaxID=1008807 RepID=A0AAW2ZDL7_9EUKA
MSSQYITPYTYSPFFIKEETLEQLLQEGLKREQLHQEKMSIDVRSSDEYSDESPSVSPTTRLLPPLKTSLKNPTKSRNIRGDSPKKELVEVEFKVGRHKPKPSDSYVTKFRLL